MFTILLYIFVHPLYFTWQLELSDIRKENVSLKETIDDMVQVMRSAVAEEEETEMMALVAALQKENEVL